MKKFNLVFVSALLIILPLGISISAQTNDSSRDTLRFPQEKHLRNIRMLTHGGENAEAYLSWNEKKLIYQSNNGNLPCDQIFTMNIDGSNKKMVSTGFGKTTCSYFLPGDTAIIYASTHLADKNCPAPPDMSRGYVWELYKTFDIFLAKPDGSNLKRLTDAYGYDAEATVSPKKDKIIFTSTRDGDPELYTMNLDGTNQKRLTFQKGYDGGAFFSQDGKKIVFRASRPVTKQEKKDYEELVQKGYVRPTALEIYTMNADGSDMKKLTNFGKASFAPFFFPDGKRIIFSSNINSKDGRNFDLYVINSDGSGLEQITFSNTFDSFPMFTRDGKHLIFASNRFGRQPHETNIFIADWVE